MSSLLIVDDDELIADSLSFALEDDFAICNAASRSEALEVLTRAAELPALALVDLGLPPHPHRPDEGFELIRTISKRYPSVRILVLSGQNDERNIHHALMLGAVDFIAKPADLTILRGRLAHHARVQALEFSDGAPAAASGDMATTLIGESQQIEELKEIVAQLAMSPFPVLIEGESGVGKELVAKALHEQGPRSGEPFVALNCAAMPRDLLEAQLFGASKGAYTGASKQQSGFFEAAARGTLFLDEVGELPVDLQAKLLRALETGDYYRLGETQPLKVAARILAATNRDLRELINLSEFRDDLYHRLAVLTIEVPALRDRDDDWQLLFRHFAEDLGLDLELTDDARSVLATYDFPGNIRELKNIVIRVSAKYAGRVVDRAMIEQELSLDEAHLPPLGEASTRDSDEQLESALTSMEFNLDQTLVEQERRYIDVALRLADGNLSKAAKFLGVKRSTLYSRIERLRRYS